MSSRRVLVGEPGIARAVEQQMRNWELARTQRLAEPPAAARVTQQFVCLSRMVGIDGHLVADPLGRRLGWPVFDREILGLMAGDDALRRRLYETLDHRDLKWWEAAMSPLIMGRQMVDDYFHRLCETVLSLVQKGAGIFLGRGLDLVLPRDQGLRVRLVSDLEARIRSVARQRDLTFNEARELIAREEAERREFFLRHFKVEPTDPTRFDLTVNLDHVAAERAVDLILAARRPAEAALEASLAAR